MSDSISSCFFSSVILILGVNSASQVTVRSSQRSFKYTPFLVSLDGGHRPFQHSTCFNRYTFASTSCTWYQQETHHKHPTRPPAHDISRTKHFTNIIFASTYTLHCTPQATLLLTHTRYHNHEARYLLDVPQLRRLGSGSICRRVALEVYLPSTD